MRAHGVAIFSADGKMGEGAGTFHVHGALGLTACGQILIPNTVISNDWEQMQRQRTIRNN
jgi:hypothetical protein